MKIDDRGTAKVTLAHEMLKSEGLPPTLTANKLLGSDEIMKKGELLVHQVEIADHDAARAREILFRHNLIEQKVGRPSLTNR